MLPPRTRGESFLKSAAFGFLNGLHKIIHILDRVAVGRLNNVADLGHDFCSYVINNVGYYVLLVLHAFGSRSSFIDKKRAPVIDATPMIEM